jgi:hypothetical protein
MLCVASRAHQRLVRGVGIVLQTPVDGAEQLHEVSLRRADLELVACQAVVVNVLRHAGVRSPQRAFIIVVRHFALQQAHDHAVEFAGGQTPQLPREHLLQ